MKKVDNKQRLFEVMSKVDKSFKYNLNEISTGSAANAFAGATSKWCSSDNSEITRCKGGNQMEKFRNYINPELKKYVESKFSDVIGFKMYKGHEKEVILEIPIYNRQDINSVEIHITPEKNQVFKNVLVKMNGHHKNEKMRGGSELLSHKHISILPTIIKRIQADLRGEKSRFNPAKPEPTIEPVQEPTPEPIQEPVQKTGFLNKIKNRFKEGVGRELGEAQFKPETYFKTLREALEAAVKMAESRGFTVDNDELFNQFGSGGVGYGETKRGSIAIYKDGKEQRKTLQIIIYRMESGKYELTTYIN